MGSGVLSSTAEVGGGVGGSGSWGRSRVWAFRLPRPSSGWFTVTNMDERREDEGWEFAEFARARRNPAALRVRFAGGMSLEESRRLDMGFSKKEN